jgi:hypothetical protein
MTEGAQTENFSTEEEARLAAEAAEACPTRLGPTLLSAVVDETRNLIRGRHAVSASRGDVPVGSYIVNFERDVTWGLRWIRWTPRVERDRPGRYGHRGWSCRRPERGLHRHVR